VSIVLAAAAAASIDRAETNGEVEAMVPVVEVSLLLPLLTQHDTHNRTEPTRTRMSAKRLYATARSAP
jgi:hypothetical protein